jgi:hypothetical protein
MRVWNNSVDEGWVQHGQDRSSPTRAAFVAKLLASRKGWESASADVRGVVVARHIDEKLRYAATAMPGVLLLEYDIRFDVREVPAL